ncbi:MAG: hypothetical protein ACOX87_05750 [Chloroflexota bacterium]
MLHPDVADELQGAERAIVDLNLRTPQVVSLESIAILFVRAEAVAARRVPARPKRGD